jgi:hypothetical protein
MIEDVLWSVSAKSGVSILSRLNDSPGFVRGTVAIAKTAHPAIELSQTSSANNRS